MTDTTGAALGHATVTITSQSTGQTYTHQTNDSGNYEFTLLPPGVYSVQVVDQGFAGSVTNGVPATVNTTNRTDVQLKPGNQAQTVTVTDMAPALQTDRADVSAQIETRQVSDLPVGSSRNFQALESLVPGVSAPIYDHSSFFDAQNSQSFQVNGQAELANNLQLEGIDDNERTGLLQVYKQQDEEMIDAAQLRQLERFVHLYEMDINVEGIETIDHLLRHLHELNSEILSLRNRLQLYEP